jgi:hypothetical protein
MVQLVNLLTFVKNVICHFKLKKCTLIMGQQRQQENQMNVNSSSSSNNHEPEILEQGDIYIK